MRKLLPGLAIVVTLAIAGVSQSAVGTVDIKWDSCTGPIDKTTTTPGLYSLYLTVTGHDQPQKAYDVRVVYGNASQSVPDAWRFDADGCETTAGIRQDVTSKTCAPFSQNAAGALQIRKVQFSFPQDPYAQTLMLVLLANSYSPVYTVNSGTRYLLERIEFDLRAAVSGAGAPPSSCGGFGQPMCFQFSAASFLDLDGNELPFNRSSQTLVASFNGPNACPGSALEARTWGALKSQYRN